MVYDYVYQKENNVYENFDYFSHHDKYVVENLSSHASGKNSIKWQRETFMNLYPLR